MKPEYQRRTSQVLDTQSSRQKEWSVACLRNWEDSMAGAERTGEERRRRRRRWVACSPLRGAVNHDTCGAWVSSTEGFFFLFLFSFFFFFFFVFFWALLLHLYFPRLGVKSQLHLLAYTTATATPELSCICDLHHSSRQLWILNPVSKARNRTHILKVTSWVHYH